MSIRWQTTARGTSIFLVSLALVLAGAPPASALTPVTVLATSADEWKPVASTDHLAWAVWTGRKNIAYAKEFGGSRFRVSRVGYQGIPGAIDGTTLVYQEYTSAGGGSSNIWFFDLETRTRRAAPARVNSKRWEYHPGLSGDWLLFARWISRTGERKLFLYNLATDDLRLVAIASGGRRALNPRQVNGDHVVYTRLSWNKRDRLTSCNVYHYSIATGETRRLPNPGPKCQWGASVNAAGAVYYARGGFDCGVKVSLRRRPPDGPAEVLLALPRNKQFATTYALDLEDGSTEVFFDPYRCGRGSDIKKLQVPGAPPEESETAAA